MTEQQRTEHSGIGRRGFLLGSAAVGVAAVAAGCTSNDSGDKGEARVAQPGATETPGKHVTLGFSAPAADHGWTAAITKNAQAQAKVYDDVTFKATEGTNDVNLQISQVETMINAKVDAIVILPFDGKSLTPVAKKAMQSDIPVINLDRIFDTPLAYRAWIGGDNYGMGVAAGNYIADTLKAKGVSNPIIGEIPGIPSLPLTQERSQGFKDALADNGMKVSNRVPAEFTVESGEAAMSNLLQAAPKLDAVWNHDDDQGIGVLAAVDSANRHEFFLVGGAGSANAMRAIKADNTVLKATVTYPPSMASDAVSLGRLVAQSRGLQDLVEVEIPASITVFSATVTKENVDKYLPLAFES
jgi:ribose transport system substrate-binding protein